MIIILSSTWKLLRDSLTLSMDAVPTNINIDKIRDMALRLAGVKDIHHIHVWAMSTAENALTAHVVISESLSHEEASKLKNELRHGLEHLGIQHATLETEIGECTDESCLHQGDPS
jgi:cobalt-zinc-cadmium efflux system protein